MVSTFNQSQVLILQTLVKHPDGLSSPDLAKKSGAAVNSGNIGPVFRNVLENYPESLHAQGYVKVHPLSEKGETVWRITKKGEKIAPTLKTLKKAVSAKVPADVLNPVVLKFAKTRTYGFEVYTAEDLKAIREALGDGYSEVGAEDLRAQIIGQRKRGAYSDPTVKIRLAVERTIRDFGPEGAIKEILTEKQVLELGALSS